MQPKDKKIAEALKGAPGLVTSTVALMEELARLLMLEIDVVTQRKLTEHAELLKAKQRLAIDYRSNMKSIATQPAMMKNLTDVAKAAVREMARRLSEAVDTNARMLRAAVDAARKLVQNVMAMVRSEALPQQTYKNLAKAHTQLGAYSPKCPPVAIRTSV